MKEKIIKLLQENKDVSAYSVVLSKISSKEAFFVKDKLDMNRYKDVFHVLITVYKDFEYENKKYRGSASIKVSPQDCDSVIREKIQDAIFAAGFVKNDWYPIPKPVDNSIEIKNVVSSSPIFSILEMQQTVYDKYEGTAKINSSEFFATNSVIEVVNSEGVDVKFCMEKNELEVITDAKGDEEVEVYGYLSQGHISKNAIKEFLQEQLINTQERAIAKKAESIPSINVIITGSDVATFFGFYKTQTSSINVYTGQSSAKIGKNFQGEITGDVITITLDPNMQGSPLSAPYDQSGIKLEELSLFEDGVVKTYHGGTRYAHYLGIKATGEIPNLCVKPGSISYTNEMKAKPYVEILMFSDFFMDATTGNFGGEFRLARWFDGKNTKIITGGSISGNMFKVQGNMYFSKEIMNKNHYKGPKAVLLPNMEIGG